MSDLRGKTLIVTGASMGIGRALALELARMGVRLVLNARHQPALDAAAAECSKLGTQAVAVAGSAAEPGTARGLVEAARRIGHFYGFVHVAGLLHPGPFLWEMTEEAFRDVFGASVIASYQMIRHAVPVLIEQGAGLAVFFGSGASQMHLPGMGAYSAAKAAEEHLARQLAEEALAITSFVYRPGVVATRMPQQALKAEGGGAEELRRIFGEYEDQEEMISPEQAAEGLMRILTDDPDRFRGQVVSWRDVSVWDA